MNNNPWPYDKDGYCKHCRVAQYKPHSPFCSLVRLAQTYPITFEFVRKCAEQLDGDLERTKQWLNAQAAIGVYVTPDAVKELTR